MQAAIQVQNGAKRYGKNTVPVLNNLNLTVPKGAVYALLGSSGCGKSTLLSCILGLSVLDEGSVHIFGKNLAELHKYNVSVGYMPQELSLYLEFTILETLQYFGTLFGILDVDRKLIEVANLLGLPNLNSRVASLSGGERRRVSLAVTLISEAKLLLMDEPTAGIDPLLRHKVWEHLKGLSTKKQITILVTTHYIDEASRADIVGVLRDGRLILEEIPQRFRQPFLDQLILQRCREMDAGIRYLDSDITPQPRVGFDTEWNSMETITSNSFQRLKALLWKTQVTLTRNVGLYIFVLLMPAVVTLITCTTFQNAPQHLPLGIVNKEVFLKGCNDMSITNDCLEGPLSCKFLEELAVSATIKALEYTSTMEAKNAVKLGLTWGVLTFPGNFSAALVDRALSGPFVSDDTWAMSIFTVQLDQTNTLIHGTIISALYQSLERFFQRISRECGNYDGVGVLPLNYQEHPLVGSANHGFIDFVVPGFSLAWLFFFPLISTSIRFITEKKQGTLQRTLFGTGKGRGTRIEEIVTAGLIVELGNILIQSSLTYYIMTGVYHVGGNSDLFTSTSFLTMVLFVLSGISGVCCGFLLGIVCSEEIHAAILSIAIFFPNSFISGLVWPIEGMPLVLQYISPFLPFTLPSESLRSLINRGWEISHPGVLPGYLVMLVYILLYCVLSIKISYKLHINVN